MLIVNCLRKSYKLIGSFPALCHGTWSHWGGKEGGGVGASEATPLGKEGRGVGASEATPLELWKGVRTVLRALQDRYTPSTSLFQITCTLLTLLVFFGISCFLGFPGVPGPGG